MRKGPLAAGLLLLLTGCVSSAMKPYEGKTLTEVRIDWGPPVADFVTPDGRRVVQYRWGGGTVALPSTMTATATTIGPTTFVSGQTTPGMVVHNEGCLVSFIATPEGNDWRVTEIRYPQRIAC